MLNFSIFSDKGGREINEDTVKVSEKGERKCFVLCDGLGGHGMGDVASQLVARIIIEEFEKSTDNEGLLETLFSKAQDALMTEQVSLHSERKMKTTAVVLLTDQDFARIGYIGDSRLYIFSKNRVKTRTIDHSVAQMMALSRRIKESEIRNHPDRNIVLRVMGIEWEKPMYELLAPVKLKKCQAFLLCSDGFWECVLEENMERLLKETDDAGEWVRRMVDIARSEELKKCDEMDNFSVIGIINK